ncbi:hypothetical protein F5Y18DRAFT_422709 [Xylariaceae sp. FL1019]|nr:hypothetical protein F5Y18DRAFT_422709 [Xylariaceae sp. FL1019]
MTSNSNHTENLSGAYPVYLGLWTNWSHGYVLGATLTVTRQNATLLIAFTSTFIAFVANRVWRTSSFFLHRCYSSLTPQDVTYHQLQAILRNASAADEALGLLMKLLCSKRRRRVNRLRIVLVAFVAIALITVFTLLGGFSSRLALPDNEVLVKSARCGYLFPGNAINDDDLFDAIADTAEKIKNAANYAQQCYSSSSAPGQLDCDRFVVRRLTSSVDMNASCPFDDSVCLRSAGNLRIDSGYIDSHIHLGMNALPALRILWKRVFHCAPLATREFTSQDTQSPTNDTLFHYGNFTIDNDLTDYVFRSRDLEAQYKYVLSQNSPSTDINYQLNGFVSIVDDGTIAEDLSDFAPIESLSRKDADTSLVMLSGNGVLFTGFTDDPWYDVSQKTTSAPINGVGSPVVNYTIHLPRKPASPIGCTEQHQFCNNKDSRQCGPLASFRDAVFGAAHVFNTTYTVETEEAAQFTYFFNRFLASDYNVVHVVKKLGPAALLSQRTLDSGLQGALSSNQWQLDVGNWWNISMAMAQAVSFDSAYGPIDPALQRLRENYTSPLFFSKMKTTAFTSLSVFGLIFTYVVGLLLMLISYALEPVSTWIHKRKGPGQYKHLEWTTNATLQLQRLAHEGIGQGKWSRGARAIPTTAENEFLALLDISNPDHPVLSPMIRREPQRKLQP